jgi:hypothetical protein
MEWSDMVRNDYVIKNKNIQVNAESASRSGNEYESSAVEAHVQTLIANQATQHQAMMNAIHNLSSQIDKLHTKLEHFITYATPILECVKSSMTVDVILAHMMICPYVISSGKTNQIRRQQLMIEKLG